MICFFVGGFEKKLSRCGGAGHQGLAVVEGLSSDFASVVHAHEGGGFALFDFGERRGRALLGIS